MLSISQPDLSAVSEAVQRGDYQAALLIHPDDPALWDQWIAASIAADQPEQTQMLIMHAAALGGWNAARRSQIAALVATHDLTGATVYRRALLAEQPDNSADNPDLLQTVIDSDLALRDWPDAIIQAQRLLASTPNDADLRYQLAFLLAPDQPQAALNQWQQLISDPGSAAYRLRAQATIGALEANPAALAISRLGVQAVGEGRWSVADYLLRRALAANGADFAVMALLGLVEEQQGRSGWPLIQQALLESPSDPLVNYAAALHWQQAGDTDQALAALTKAQGRDPNNPALAAALGTLSRQRGDYADAVLWFSKAIALAPNDASSAELLAALYADEHYALDSGGLTFIQSAAARFPKDADLAASLGAGLLATGQTAAALDELRTAVALGSPVPTARVYYYLGTALESDGDTVGAQNAYMAAYQTTDSSGSAFRDLAGRALERLNGH